jgi:hypothetical protein
VAVWNPSRLSSAAALAGFDGLVRDIPDPKPPLPPGIHLGIGTGAMIVAAVVAAAFTDPATVQRLLVMALAVGLGAALIRDWRYSVALAAIGYLLYLGFLVNNYGELTWHGSSSLWDLTIFIMAYLLGLAQRWIRSEVRPQERDPKHEVKITGSSK